VIAADEVIVCAGTYESPGLLLRSGIGPAADVVGLGRSVVADLPGVGANLADHPWVSIDLRCPPPEGDPAIFQLVATTHSSLARVPGGAPDLQLMVFGPYPIDDGFGCSLATALLKPRSRGRIRLRSLDPAAAPDIDLAYFRDASDLTRLTEGLRLADEATRSSPLLEISQGSRLGPLVDVIAGRDATGAWIRSSTNTYHHPVGTCAMGADPETGAVVGPDGAVHGVDRLSVVDASVMPDLPSANTNLPTIMLAEHVAARRRRRRAPAAPHVEPD
jgi:choline dehydrogenase